MIGKMEELTLLACLQAGEQKSASQVYDELCKGVEGSKPPAFGAIYTTLSRMVIKGFLIESSFQDATGQRRRAFTVSADGRSSLRNALLSTARLGGFALSGGF